MNGVFIGIAAAIVFVTGLVLSGAIFIGPKRIFVAIALVLVAGLGLVVADYVLLDRARCDKPDYYRVAKLRGIVVGRSLGVVQYRWLRRRFMAIGTTLELSTAMDRERRTKTPTRPADRSIVRERQIDASGQFDFGDLPSDEYALAVQAPGEDAVAFHVVIDPAVPNEGVLIDASPAYYCRCCGWDFEPR